MWKEFERILEQFILRTILCAYKNVLLLICSLLDLIDLMIVSTVVVMATVLQQSYDCCPLKRFNRHLQVFWPPSSSVLAAIFKCFVRGQAQSILFSICNAFILSVIGTSRPPSAFQTANKYSGNDTIFNVKTNFYIHIFSHGRKFNSHSKFQRAWIVFSFVCFIFKILRFLRSASKNNQFKKYQCLKKCLLAFACAQRCTFRVKNYVGRNSS